MKRHRVKKGKASFRFYKDSLGWCFTVRFKGNLLTVGEFKSYKDCVDHYLHHYKDAVENGSEG